MLNDHHQHGRVELKAMVLTIALGAMAGVWVGSEVHVRLSLCRSSHQVVMADEHLDGTNRYDE
jgi:hypothetical protein